ncbi:S8 family serine peptidase [Streptomyces sp. NPDC002659]|uniref:S8 family serine peptidase n=1 Tax=Streptomyces sp. NPDC002659 TaxID=3364656 RepID=UPI0036813B9C
MQALYVRPVGGYWPLRIDHPRFTVGQETVMELQALADTFEGFPGRAATGWGAQAMRLHQIPPTYRGHGIKIALLDSGVNTAHPDLKDTVLAGHDFTTGDGGAWQANGAGHGTWCAGIIAAADNRTGITGIAAEAEVHALKLFPGGRVSDLLQAVDYCITHDIDIAQISLAYGAPSHLVAWKLLDTHAAGIAILAPAGDTAGPVTHPAALRSVLAVGAIAHTGTYPTGSPFAAAQPPWPGPYPAPFTPAGPGVDLVAPGAAVITTAPGDGYTSADGTAAGAPPGWPRCCWPTTTTCAPRPSRAPRPASTACSPCCAPPAAHRPATTPHASVPDSLMPPPPSASPPAGSTTSTRNRCIRRPPACTRGPETAGSPTGTTPHRMLRPRYHRCAATVPGADPCPVRSAEQVPHPDRAHP